MGTRYQPDFATLRHNGHEAGKPCASPGEGGPRTLIQTVRLAAPSFQTLLLFSVDLRSGRRARLTRHSILNPPHPLTPAPQPPKSGIEA